MNTTIDRGRHAISSNRRAVMTAIAATIGLSFDLFDLFILLYVAPAVGKAFFSANSLSLAAVYASFAVLFMRPVGGALFRNYADHHGRKKAMVIAVTGAGIATAGFGFLPTFPQIGILASILFIRRGLPE